MIRPLIENNVLLLGRYRIKKYLAEGGMQQVFVAEDEAFKRAVAVKVPKNSSAEKRFARSAQVSARITHANVAKTLDYFVHEERAYLVEELIDGIDLEAALKSRYMYFDPHLAAHFVHLCVKGLAAAHHADVFHRDLKPSNIMIGNDSNLATVKITDFGIAKMAEKEMEEAIEGGEATLTNSQTAVGTLPYMAPEMINDPKTASRPADVWAIGAILYRLVSGVLPYGSGFQAIPAILAAKLPARPSHLTANSQFASLGTNLIEVIEACLTADPLARPTADQLVTMCAQLCYSDAPRVLATVESVSAAKRGKFGYLVGETGKRYFFHQQNCYASIPVEDSKVLISAFDGNPYPRAFPVLPLKAK